MKNRLHIALLAVLALLPAMYAPWAEAQSCEAYYPFDGTLADASGNGFEGRMIGQDGAAATPRFVDGRSGQALAFDGTAAMRAFLNLNYESCPQVSFTAWIRFEGPVRRDNQVILATGGSGPGLKAGGSVLALNGTANGIWARDAVHADSGWMFVAGVYDYAGNTYTLHWRNRSVEGTLSEHRYPPDDALWVGAMNSNLTHPASNIVIDELRIIGRALDLEELRALQTGDSSTRISASASGTGDWRGMPCAQHAQCPAGSYCGIDGQCHPDQHAPMPETPRGSGITATRNPIQPGSTISTPRGAPLSETGSVPEESSARPPVGVSQLPEDLQNPDLETMPRGAPDLGSLSEDENVRPPITVSQVPEDLQNPDLESRPPGAPDLTYESEEAAQEAAEQRERRAEEEAEGDIQRNFIWVQFPTDILVFSGVSGAAGDYTEQSVATGLPQRLPYWIETRENYDKPCTVYVHTRAIQMGFGEPEPFTNEYDVCDEGLPRVNPFTTLHRAFNEPSAGEFGLVTGIQVCSNGINRRVKGIRARVRGLNLRTGAYSANYSTQVFQERSNCVSWDEMAHCPANTYAVGLRLHFRDGDVVSPRDFLSGLELVCAEALVRRSGQAP